MYMYVILHLKTVNTPPIRRIQKCSLVPRLSYIYYINRKLFFTVRSIKENWLGNEANRSAIPCIDHHISSYSHIVLQWRRGERPPQ